MALTIGFACAMAWSLFMSFLVWQVLFYGWKEQEHREDSSAKDEDYTKVNC